MGSGGSIDAYLNMNAQSYMSGLDAALDSTQSFAKTAEDLLSGLAPNIGVNTDDAAGDVQAMHSLMEDMCDDVYDIKLNSDPSEVIGAVDSVKDEVTSMSSEVFDIHMTLQDNATDQLEVLQQISDNLDGLSPTIKPTVDNSEATAGLNVINNKVDDLGTIGAGVGGIIAGIGIEKALSGGIETATGLGKAWRNWVGSLQEAGMSFEEATGKADQFKTTVNDLAAAGQSNDSLFKNIAGLVINLNTSVSDSTLQMTEHVVAGYEMLGARSGATIYEVEKELKAFLSTGDLGKMQDTLSSLKDPAKWQGLLEGATTVDERISVLRDMLQEEGIMGALNIDAPTKSMDMFKALFDAGMTSVGNFILLLAKPFADLVIWLDTATGGASTMTFILLGLGLAFGVMIVGALGLMTPLLSNTVAMLGLSVAGMGLAGTLDFAALSFVAFVTGESVATVATWSLTGALWAMATALLANPITWIVIAIVALVVAIQELGKYMGWWKDWGTMVESFTTGIKRLWSAFINNEAVQGTITGIQSAWTGLISFFHPVITFFKDIWNKIFPPQTGEFDIVRGIIDGFTTLQGVASTVFSVVSLPIRLVVRLFTELAALFSGPVSSSGNALMGVFGALSPVLSLIGNVVMSVLIPPFNLLSAGLSIVADIVNGYLIAAFQTLWGILSAVGGFLMSIYNILNQFANGAISGPQAVGMAWNALKTMLAGIFVAIMVGIGSFVVSMVTRLRTGASNAVTAFITFVRTLPSKTLTYLLQTVSRVISFASNAMSAARNAGSSIVTGIMSYVRSIPRLVYSEFMNIPGRIASTAGAIGGAIYNLGRGMVAKLKASLKIQSPGIMQRLMVNEFTSVPGQIINAIPSMLSATAQFAKKMTRSVEDNLNTDFAVGVSYSGATLGSLDSEIINGTNVNNVASLNGSNPVNNRANVNINIGDTIIQGNVNGVDDLNIKMKKAKEDIIHKVMRIIGLPDGSTGV